VVVYVTLDLEDRHDATVLVIPNERFRGVALPLGGNLMPKERPAGRDWRCIAADNSGFAA